MIASNGKRGLLVIGNEVVRRGDIPLFLCPLLADHRAQSRTRPRIRHSQPMSISRNVASTSAAIIAIPHPDTSAHRDSPVWRELPLPVARSSNTASVKISKREEVLQQLSYIEETIDDILKRPNHFHSGFEKVFMLLEARHDIEGLWDSQDEVIRMKVQRIAPKLALEMVKLSKPEQSLKLLQIVSTSWSKQEEMVLRDLWQPAVKQMISVDLLELAAKTIRLLCKETGLGDDWMSRMYLQVLLKVVESKKSIEIENEVDTWWEVYERIGEPVPLFVTLQLLASQLIRHDHQKAQATLHAMKRHHHHIDTTFWRRRIWPTLRVKKMKGLLEALVSRTENMTTTVEELMSHYAKKDNLKECLRVLKRFNLPTRLHSNTSMDIIKPTMVLYGSLIDLFSQRDQADHAIRYLEIAREYKCEGNYLHAYLRLNSILERQKRFKESFIIAIQLLNTSWQDSLPDRDPVLRPIDFRFMRPNQPLYSKILYVLSQTKHNDLIVSAARLLLLDILFWGEPFSDAIRHRLVLIVRQLGRGAPVIRLNSYLKRLFALGDEVDVEKKKEWENFVEYFQRGGGIDEIKIIEYEKSPKSYADAEQKGRNVMPESLQLKQEVKNNDTVKESVDWSLSAPPAHQGLIDAQYPAFSSSSNESSSTIELSSNLSSSAYAMRIRVYAVIRKDFDNALAIFNHMVEQGVKPTSSHLGPLIEGMVLNGYITEAYQVKEKAMIDSPGKKLSIIVYSALARGLGQIGKWKAVLSIADEMRIFNLKISRTLKELFQVAVKIVDERRSHLQLQSPLEHQRKANKEGVSKHLPELLPESYDIDSVFRRFGFFHHRKRFIMAQKQVEKALKRGLIADSRLRKALDRSDNLLRKQLCFAEAMNRSSRHIDKLQNALNLCRDNRGRVKALPQDLDKLNEVYNKDAEKRQQMVKLIKDALLSDQLLEEAQRLKKKEK